MTTREYRASLRRDLQPGSYCAQFKTYHDEMKENENEEPPVTEAELARVAELDAQATRGDFFILPEPDGKLHQIWASRTHRLDVLVARTCFAPESAANAQLFAEYRTLTPRLARELAAARAAIKVARGALNDCVNLLVTLENGEPFCTRKAATAALAQLNTHTHE